MNFKAIAALSDGKTDSAIEMVAGGPNEIAKFEGVPVRVNGFVVAVRPSGAKEATNCRFTKAVETDRHMGALRCGKSTQSRPLRYSRVGSGSTSMMLIDAQEV